LTATRWSEIRQLFHDVVDLPPAEQVAILGERNDDPTVVLEVRRLLDLHRKSNGVLDNSLPEIQELQRWIRGPSLAEGAVLARRFEIRALIGVGGMGEVYLAYDHDLGGEIAVKILRPEFQGNYTSLLREVQTARMITHPNVCRIFDIGRDSALAFITMELLTGETLADMLRHGPLAPEELVLCVEQVTLGLRAAHAAGILHRDLKPGNVVRSSPSRFVITDFGLAHEIGTGGSEASGLLVGTMGYIAPEVIAGRSHSVASDIYSLGVLLHEAATGRLPFDHCDSSSASSKRTIAAITGRTFHSRLNEVIGNCLELDPGRRPASVVDIRNRLFKTGVARRRLLIGSAGAAALAAVSLSLRFLRSLDRSPEFGRIDAVLMTSMHNTTGNPRFDGLTAVMAGQLSQSPKFALISESRRRDLLARMQRDPGTLLTAPVARELALRNGRTAVVYGQISLLGSEYLLDLKIEEPGSRPDDVRHTASRRFQAAGPDELLDQIRRASLWVREVIGELPTDRDRYNRAPSELTTSNWDALALQQQAQELRTKGRTPEAIALLREALRLDPGFASARRDLADILIAEDQLSEGYAEWLAAVQASRQRQLNSRERFHLEASYFEDTDDMQSAENIDRLWMAAYPGDYLPLFYLGNVCLRLFRLPEGLEHMTQAARRDSNVTVLAHLVRHLAMCGKFNEANRYIAEIERSGYESDAKSLRGILQLVSGESELALASYRTALEAEQRPEFRHYHRLAMASILADLGRNKDGELLLIKGCEEDERTGSPQRYGDKLGTAAYLAWRSGDLRTARSRAIEASGKAGVLNERVAVALVRSGAIMQAETVIRRLRKLPNLPRFMRLRDRIDGELRVARGDFKGGLGALHRAESLTNAWTLNDALPRALALAGQQREAAKYYRMLFNRRALYWYLPGVLAPGLVADASHYSAV